MEQFVEFVGAARYLCWCLGTGKIRIVYLWCNTVQRFYRMQEHDSGSYLAFGRDGLTDNERSAPHSPRSPRSAGSETPLKEAQQVFTYVPL